MGARHGLGGEQKHRRRRSAARAASRAGPSSSCAGSSAWAKSTASPRCRRFPAARFQNICISREAGAGRRQLARLVGPAAWAGRSTTKS